VGPDHIAAHGIACILAESLAAQGRDLEALSLLDAGLPVIRTTLAQQTRGQLQQRRLREYEALQQRLRSKIDPSAP
jgi:hypothetical protein